MTRQPHTITPTEPPALRVQGPPDLLQAVPYLLGFHPAQSLVIVGLDCQRLIVTVRVDLVDLALPDVLADAVTAMRRGGATTLIGAVFDDAAVPVARTDTLPWHGVARSLRAEADRVGCRLGDVLLVAGQRWWSFTCQSPDCCPPQGRPLREDSSPFPAAATYAGLVALPDRESVAALLDPMPDPARGALRPLLGRAEQAAVHAVVSGNAERHDRSVKRAMFAAARRAGLPGRTGGPEPVGDEDAARFGVALSNYSMRDAVWMAADDGRLDGRELWRDLARRLPSPYDAAPLFLFGWTSWRAGDGALAGIAAQRAVDSDRTYSAADLLLAALARGVDPRRLPRLRLPRSV